MFGQYETMIDPVTDDPNAFISGPVFAKFCTMGIVSSKKWFPCYVTTDTPILPMPSLLKMSI